MLTEIQVANRQIEGPEIPGDQEGRIEFALRNRIVGKAICAFSGIRVHHGHRTIDEQYGKPDDGIEKANSDSLKNCNTYVVHICRQYKWRGTLAQRGALTNFQLTINVFK